MIPFELDPNSLPTLSAVETARHESMTEAELTAAALSDLDNPPLTSNELARVAAARYVRAVRVRSGLSQAQFSRTFHINVARLRDLEQGRTRADSALLAYLRVIDEAPGVVRRALGDAG